MKKNLVPLILLCLISSCEREFEIPERHAAKRMVINSMFSDSWPMTVYLTSSYATAGSNNITAINDAQLLLYEDGVYLERLNYFPSDTSGTFGAYRSASIPKFGKNYKIMAQHPAYGIATAEDEIPLPPEIISQELIQYPDTINRLQDALVNFKFKDDGGKENFYRLNAWIEGTYSYVNSPGDTVERSRNYGLRTDVISAVSDTVRDGWFMLFSDKGFNGAQQEMKLQFTYTPYSSDFSSLRLWVELFTVSKTHYEYFRTLQLTGNHNGNSEPVHVFSNVQNGYGIFAAEDFQRMEFVIK